MSKVLSNLILILLVLIGTSALAKGPAKGAIYAHFSPNGSPTTAVVSALDRARATVRVQAYSFTSAPIAGALKRAHERGVDVQVILDKSQPKQRYTAATFLKTAKIPLFIDTKHAIAHNKVMIIDSRVVVTGSFNFTKAAEEKNAENLLIIKSAELAQTYLDNWEKHKDHSE
jgi:phosphatidylserine/phosphatidylglycerophosphate/cardiolipin synthase-like enzyme